jgi:aarF domain-containing kinase
LQTANASAGIPAQMQLGLLSPLYLRRLFERMGATYIKLGQVIFELCFMIDGNTQSIR